MSRKILSTIIILVLGFLWTLSVCADGPDPKGPSNLTPQEKYLMAIQAYEKCLDNWKEVSIIVARPRNVALRSTTQLIGSLWPPCH